MSELCRFDGISIRMHSGDHPPPHIHVKYSGVEARISLEGFEELDRGLPRPVIRKVRRWAETHEKELWQAWEEASAKRNPGRIAR